MKVVLKESRGNTYICKNLYFWNIGTCMSRSVFVFLDSAHIINDKVFICYAGRFAIALINIYKMWCEEILISTCTFFGIHMTLSLLSVDNRIVIDIFHTTSKQFLHGSKYQNVCMTYLSIILKMENNKYNN
jgi:hypothetical protein